MKATFTLEVECSERYIPVEGHENLFRREKIWYAVINIPGADNHYIQPDLVQMPRVGVSTNAREAINKALDGVILGGETV